MISVYWDKDDYAIMKQVQQLKLAYPRMSVCALDEKTDFSQLGADEKLFLVGHGNIATGDFRSTDRYEMTGWLKAGGTGVPQHFGGIVLCSCYSGLGGDYSLARHIAQGLAGKAAAGTAVGGANGYSFGTPEFAQSGLSSVLRRELDGFYTFTQESMVTQWLAHKPTHTGGVLATQWHIDVRTDRTIQENVDASGALDPDAVKNQLIHFGQAAKGHEDQLKQAIVQIGGGSLAEQTTNLMTGNTAAVQSWNTAIAEQYQLYRDYYLWASTATAFTVEQVG
jgi:hypothetical protein